MWCCFAWYARERKQTDDLIIACRHLHAEKSRMTFEKEKERHLEGRVDLLLQEKSEMHMHLANLNLFPAVFTGAAKEELDMRLRNKLGGQTCPITLEIMQDHAVLGCGHVFERSAYIEWAEISSECPLCKNKSRLINRI